MAVRHELALLPTIAVGLAGAAVAAFAHQGSGAIAAQQDFQAWLNPHQLAAILLDTREPVPSGTGAAATSATCKHGSSGAKLNPWTCTVGYGRGARVTYRIDVALNGSFTGADRTGTRTVHGCCVLGVARSSRSS